MEDLFPAIPEDYAALSDDDLAAFIADTADAVDRVTASPSEFANDEVSADDVFEATTAAVEALEAARAEYDSRAAAAAEVETEATVTDEPAAEDRFAELATRAELASEVEEPEPAEEPEPEVETAAVEEVVTAAAPVAPAPTPAAPARRRPLPRASRDRKPVEAARPRVSITAAAPSLGYEVGEALPNEIELALMMEKRRSQFGNIPSGTRGEKIPIARADWSDRYGEERTLTKNEARNMELVASAVNDTEMRQRFEARLAEGLTASGGLCAPSTPYYDLQMISIADRPVRAALPAFNADRGGIRYARPAALSAITTGVGVRTADEDAAGGSEAEKTCQVVDCPDFDETDVQIIFHCLQFGNLGARTFPERVAQWNNLILAAHARLAESELLTGIDTFSTFATAGDLGLGASSTLPSQIITAAAAMRSRNRMAANAILRVMLPAWVLDLLVSDMYRTQFQRFDMSGDQFVALLRANNVEPSFYLDSANGRGQVFDPQTPSAGLEAFPATIMWYLFPEGSFLFVDGGILELGLVRDSVLNRTNDFQIFGESFENVAFVGVESLAVQSTTCDSGTVSLPTSVTCPITY